MAAAANPAGPGWLAFHVHHSGDRDQLLDELARPLVSALLRRELVDRFFFVRYSLGGPHVRLRLRALPGGAGPVGATVLAASREYLIAHPPERTCEQERVLATNRALVAQDGGERDNAFYPDGTVREAPCRFEVERYGGPELLDSSLDFFALSSVRSLAVVRRFRRAPERRLPAAMLLLLRHALGSSRDPEELLDLVRAFPVPSWSKAPERVLARGDRTWELQRPRLLALLRDEAASLAGSPPGDIEMARRLRHEIQAVEPARRLRILASQLHMTANRLGLSNLEEVYLSRLLWLALHGLAEADGAAWEDLTPALAGQETGPEGCLRDLLPAAFAELAAG